MTQQEIAITLNLLEEKLKKESKAYGIFTIILSTLDVLCGVLCLIFTTIQLTAVVMSIASGTLVCARAIQVLKTKNLLKTIRVLNGLSSTYIVCRIKKGEYMKNFIKQNKLTLLVSLLGFIVCGIAGYCIAAWFTTPIFVRYIAGGVSAILAVVLVMILGKENSLEFFTRVAVTKLPKEYQEQAVEAIKKVQTLVETEKEAIAQKEALKLEVQKAKATVDAYESANESYQKAKQLVETNRDLLVEDTKSNETTIVENN